MKNILKIYKKDLNDIHNNFVLLVIIVGLAILPSLYAWFNIKASWDPYGSTGNIKVAVVNQDNGYTVLGKDINIGDELVEKLSENNNLGWIITDRQSALEKVESGEYYALIDIPSNFSKNLSSLVTDDIQKGEIIYTVNEKINAIAPKITDKGASTVQLEVNQTIVKTVSEIIFDVFNNIGIEIENQLPKLTQIETSLVEVQNKFSDFEETVNLAGTISLKSSNIISDIQSNIPLIVDTLDSSKSLASDLKVFLEDTKGNINDIAPIIKDDLGIIESVSSSLSTSTTNIINAIKNNSEDLPLLVDNLQNKLSTLKSVNETLLSFLNKLNNFSSSNLLDGVISKLNTINEKLNSAISILDSVKNDLDNNNTPVTDTLDSLNQIFSDVNSISSNLLDNFDSEILNPINNIFESSFTVTNNVISILEDAEDKLPEINDLLSSSKEFTSLASDDAEFIKEKLPLAKSIVDDLTSAIKEINNSNDMSELVSLLENDIVNESEFLKKPVDLVTNKLYPINNYGSAMTPFYTVLSLWVGVLLLTSLLSTNVHGDYNSLEVYFGRGLTFLTIAIIQGLIVSIGDIYLLGVSVVHPYLFVLYSVFTSVVFTVIVYSLASVFSNVGKAMAVVLLVIQVAASGGTFPIQVTPEFFQVVNPFLPFTYAINGLREMVGGIYMPNLTKDTIALLIFMIVFMVLNTLLKKPINKATSSLRDKFNSSDLTGH